MKENELSRHLVSAFQEDVKPSAEFELKLFHAAEGLLAERREAPRMRVKKVVEPWRPFRPLAEAFRYFVTHPAPQLLTVTCLLAVAIFVQNTGNKSSIHFTDLPEFLKDNDAPEKYDELQIAERQAYEKEVLHARNEGSDE